MSRAKIALEELKRCWEAEDYGGVSRQGDIVYRDSFEAYTRWLEIKEGVTKCRGFMDDERYQDLLGKTNLQIQIRKIDLEQNYNCGRITELVISLKKLEHQGANDSEIERIVKELVRLDRIKDELRERQTEYEEFERALYEDDTQSETKSDEGDK